MASYPTYEAAAAALIADGFERYQSCIDGADMFRKDSKVDDALGGYPWPALCMVQEHIVNPVYAGPGNYFTVRFL